MSDDHANEIRLIANEIMGQLYEAGQRGQLDLLRRFAEVAIDDIDEKKKSK